MNDNEPVYYTAAEVAERLGLCFHTACEMIRGKQIPGVLRASKPYRVSRAIFDAWTTGAV